MSTEQSLKGDQRAAIVLLSLSQQSASTIMSLMDQSEVLVLAAAMANLGFVESLTINSVLRKFKDDFFRAESTISNPATATESILGGFLSKEEVSKILSKVQGSVWKALEMIRPDVLAKYLSRENPQVSAIVLSKIKPSVTALVLSHLDQELGSALMDRVVSLKPIAPKILDHVEKSIKMELMGGMCNPETRVSVAKQLAATLRNMPEAEKNKYLDWLRSRHQDMAQSVEDLMFSFEDIVRIDIKGFGVLIGAVDHGDLTIALKKASSSLQKFFFENLPQRMAKMIEEEWEVMGKIRLQDVNNAQANIMAKVKALISEGKLSLRSEDEEYV